MRKLSIAVSVVSALAVALLAGCGGGGGGSSSGNNTPTPTTDTILTGKVISSKDGSGVANVQVSFGVPAITAVTNSSGEFSLNLGSKTALEALPTPPYVFQVDTSGAGSDYPTDWPVTYNNTSYSQSEITVPNTILSGAEKNLGTIIVMYKDENNPPPPPY